MKRLLAPTLVLFLATSLFGQDEERVSTLTRIEKQSSTVTGDRGLFTVPSVETLNKRQKEKIQEVCAEEFELMGYEK